MADLGTDIDCVADLSPSFAVVSGRKALAQAIARRLQTPAGALVGDPEYGFDVRAYLGEAFTPRTRLVVEVGVAAECEKDERVSAARADAQFNAAARTLTLAVALEDAAGPFTLVLAASAVTVAILRAE